MNQLPRKLVMFALLAVSAWFVSVAEGQTTADGGPELELRRLPPPKKLLPEAGSPGAENTAAHPTFRPGNTSDMFRATPVKRLPPPEEPAPIPPKRLLPKGGGYSPDPRSENSPIGSPVSEDAASVTDSPVSEDAAAFEPPALQIAAAPEDENEPFAPLQEALPKNTELVPPGYDYEVADDQAPDNPIDLPMYPQMHDSGMPTSESPHWGPVDSNFSGAFGAQTPIHQGLTAWWDTAVTQSARAACGSRSLSINDLISAALQHSSEIRVISDTPLVRDTAIVEAASAFDWAAFVEANWTDVDEPVGSTLTTGGPSRFSNQLMQYELGLRRRTSTGGRFEVGQRFGWERSNSVFFIPNDQGTTRLTLNYTQPVLRGAGKVYNNSLILLAQVESGIARDEFSRELQGFLLDVTKAYWSLYLERASLLQRKQLYENGEIILEKLEARQATDAVANQIVRARAAVAARRSDLFRAEAAVKNAEGRIRALVNDPDLGCIDELELMPSDAPCTDEVPLCLPDVIQSAVQNRPEIHAAIKQIKASNVRVNLTKNELLPALDLVLETYVAGLRGQDGIGVAWTDMFSAGAPSYSAGIQFEVPLRNREAKARFLRRALELRQFQSQLQSTLNALQLEVEVAVREVQTAFQEVGAKHEAMLASQSEVRFIEERWALLPGDDRSAALYLEDLLAAQERLVSAEFEFANAKVTYNLALMDLKRANGTLLQCEQIQVHRTEDRGIPSLELSKPIPVTGWETYDMPASSWSPPQELAPAADPNVIEGPYTPLDEGALLDTTQIAPENAGPPTPPLPTFHPAESPDFNPN